MQLKNYVMPSLIALTVAVSGAADAADTQSVKQKLTDSTGLVAERVTPTAVPGIWEIFIQDRLFYTDDNARYIFSGRMIDTKTQQDLTSERLRTIAREMWKDLPFQDAVKQVFGKGERQIVVFSDANCTYCRTLERAYAEVGNLTVYTFIVPMLRGEENAREIVCAKDPSQAWHEWMNNRTRPAEVTGQCDTSVLSRNLALATRFSITGAPTIFFPSGDRSTGALSAEQLRSALEQIGG